MVYDFNLKQHI